MKLNPKTKKSEKKSNIPISSKGQHLTSSTTKRNIREKLLSPSNPKFLSKKEMTEIGSCIRTTKNEKEKKGLKKGRQQKSQAKWKF